MALRLAGVAFTALLAAIVFVQPGFAAGTDSTPQLHTVQAGETLWSIGRMHGLTPESLARANGLPSLDRLRIGQRLVIPAPSQTPPPAARPEPASASVHVVQTGDTLWTIARRHDLTVDRLVALNGLTDADRLQLGQTLLLTQQSGTPQAARNSSPRPSPRQAARLPRLIWPSRGIITSRFGYRWGRHHHGIDISAPVGTPIAAALDGTVQFAGWMSGYGRLVILDHGGGLTTYYGHASQILVKVGNRVKQGQLIARVGATGEVTGPNLHFEVRKNKVPLDPLTFLQSQR
jgi:murein DD-endopeptidase MepM/ murein hydrolase activator NlpD